MMPKLAVFDLDGTLIDSRQIIQEAMSQAFDRAGLDDPGYDRVRRTVGMGLREALTALAPGAPADVMDELQRGYADAFVILRESEFGQERVYDGAVDLLEALVADGWLLSVATGKSKRGVERTLKLHSLARHFKQTRCIEDGPGKPHPFMAQSVIEALGVAPACAVVIGDSEHDMRMARAAGCRALGVTWGFGHDHELTAAGAHEVHGSFASLTASLDRFAGKSAA